MIRALLFDLDGVLVDTYAVWYHLLNDVARRLGYPAISDEVYRPTWGQGIEQDVARFFPRHGVDEIARLYLQRYGDHLAHVRAMEGAREFLGRLELPRAVITNSLNALARRALGNAGLDGFFPVVVGGDDVPRSKPAPDMVVEACRRLGVAPAEAAVVGDSDFDAEAAQAAGAPFVRFRSFAELRLPQ